MTLRICNTPSFARVVKKLHSRDEKIAYEVVLRIAKNPHTGQEKVGDLAEVFVHKFKLNKQETLLAYRLEPNKVKPTDLVLLAIGPRENFHVAPKR